MKQFARFCSKCTFCWFIKSVVFKFFELGSPNLQQIVGISVLKSKFIALNTTQI